MRRLDINRTMEALTLAPVPLRTWGRTWLGCMVGVGRIFCFVLFHYLVVLVVVPNIYPDKGREGKGGLEHHFWYFALPLVLPEVG